MIDHDVYAGTTEACDPKWLENYDGPQFASATCRRCGSAVGALTRHDEWHDELAKPRRTAKTA